MSAADNHVEVPAFIDKTRGRLVVWEAMDTNPLCDPYRHHPGITFMSWNDVPELPEDVRRNSSPDHVPWQMDETLSYRGDGHPTPKANGLIARAIARRVLAR